MHVAQAFLIIDLKGMLMEFFFNHKFEPALKGSDGILLFYSFTLSNRVSMTRSDINIRKISSVIKY